METVTLYEMNYLLLTGTEWNTVTFTTYISNVVLPIILYTYYYTVVVAYYTKLYCVVSISVFSGDL